MRQPPIRSFEEWQRSLQNFDWLRDDVPGATDFDMVIHASNEGRDNFLVFEFKKAGQRLPRGQSIVLRALQNAGWTVVVCYGPDKDGQFLLSWDWQGFVSKEELGSKVKEWWDENKARKAA